MAMQVVEAVFPYLPLRDPDTAGSIVLALLAAGFPVVLVLAWFLQLVPPSLRREGAAAAGEAGEGRAEAHPRELRTDSVAVLPFENLGADTEDEYFSDGVTDDIIAAVAHIEGLRVLCRTSVMQYKRVERRVGEIAAELGVATIVTGSVRRSGDRVRIVAEVVDARSEDHLWSETYDRELQDIFLIQSDVAARIAEAVERELSVSDRSRIEARGTKDPHAYDLYLKARSLWNRRTERTLDDCVRHLKLAIETDPGFTVAHSSLAEAYVVLGIYGAREPKEVVTAAREAADAALRLDPELGEAVAAKACVTALYDWEWSDAERGFQRALELAPSYPTAHHWLAMNVLTPLRRFDDAHRALHQAEELDPESMAIAVSHGIVAYYARDFDTARTRFERVLAQDPRFHLAHLFAGLCLKAQGDAERAIPTLQRASELADHSSESLAALAAAFAMQDDEDGARRLLRRLEERARQRYVSPTLFSEIHTALGETERALEALEHAAEVRATDLVWIGVRPTFDPLRDQPRFAALVDRIGLS